MSAGSANGKPNRWTLRCVSAGHRGLVFLLAVLLAPVVLTSYLAYRHVPLPVGRVWVRIA